MRSRRCVNRYLVHEVHQTLFLVFSSQYTDSFGKRLAQAQVVSPPKERNIQRIKAKQRGRYRVDSHSISTHYDASHVDSRVCIFTMQAHIGQI